LTNFEPVRAKNVKSEKNARTSLLTLKRLLPAAVDEKFIYTYIYLYNEKIRNGKIKTCS